VNDSNPDRVSFSAPAVTSGGGPLYFERWREEFARNISRVEATTFDSDKFAMSTRALCLPTLLIAENSGAHCSLLRTRELLRDGNDAFHFSVCVAGRCEFRFEDGTAALEPGKATIYTSNKLGGCVVDASVSTLHVRISREVARTIAPAIENNYLRIMSAHSPALHIYVSYLQALLSNADGLTAPLLALADDQLREILAHLLDPASDLARAAPYGGVKAARLRCILQDIETNLVDPTLSAASVGLRLGLSGRYVQQLFEGAGLSFSGYVCDLRLDRARRLLGDAGHSHLRITDICAMAGFCDLSHFNRRYKARFGLTPRDTRNT